MRYGTLTRLITTATTARLAGGVAGARRRWRGAGRVWQQRRKVAGSRRVRHFGGRRIRPLGGDDQDRFRQPAHRAGRRLRRARRLRARPGPQGVRNGLLIGGTHYSVEIIDKDSQSDPRSAQVANDLINSDKVDLLLTTSTPETVNPVSDAAEASGVPCISTVVPWEAWYFGRQANPGKPSPFKYTYHFCFGVAQFANAYTHLWPQVPTNKKVGVMWPNDADGNAIRANLGPLLQEGGLHDRRSRRLRRRHERLLRADRQVQIRALRDLQHLPHPAGLRHLLAAGRAAGLQAEDRPDRQDGPLPVAGHLPRLDRRQPRQRRLLGADLAVHVVAHRRQLERPRRRLRASDRQGVEPAAWREPRAVRRRRRRAQGERQSEG